MYVMNKSDSKTWTPHHLILAALSIELLVLFNDYLIDFSEGTSGMEIPATLSYSMYGLYMTGYGRYAKSKGYSLIFGIVGLFMSAGLIFLFVLPEKKVVEEGETSNLIVPPPQEFKAVA